MSHRAGGPARIAIIGAGAVGVSVADALERRGLLERASLTVYEPKKAIGRGNAYCEDVASAVLNRQAEFMSVRASDPGHFVRWMGNHPDSVVRQHAKPGSFPPRSIFGEYAGEAFDHVVQRSARRPVEVIHKQVTGMWRDGEGLQVGAGREARQHDVAVVCVGTSPAGDPYGLAGHDSFIGNPYPLWQALHRIHPRDHVAILGSGLTAVDVALELLARGHTGLITMISRHGRLPGVRQPHCEYSPVVLTEGTLRKLAAEGTLTLRSVFELMQAELRAHGAEPDALRQEADPREPVQRRLRRHLAMARTGELWQPLLIAAANDLIELAWQYWPDQEKRAYLALYHHIFQGLCNPMPSRSAERLLEAMETGQLRVLPGILSAGPAGERKATIEAESGVTIADTVIDCTRRPVSAVSAPAESLTGSLVSSGYGQADAFGGLTIDPATNRLMSSAGSAAPDIFLLGEMTGGSLYYTSSLAMITRRVEIVATEIEMIRGV